VSLVALFQDIRKRTIWLGLWPWDIQLLGIGRHGRTSNASGKDMHRPRSSAIQARWPYGASNSRYMCMACGPLWHLGRQRGGVTENTGHPGEER
jgi:hypothetical protein